MRTDWFFYFIKKAISQRAGRFFLAVFSVALFSMVLTAYLQITLGIKETLGRALRRFGANMIVTPARGGFITDEVMERLRAYEGVRAVIPQIYGSITVEGVPVNMIGVELEKFNPGRLRGSPPERAYEVMVGTSLARALSLGPGMKIEVDRTKTLTVSGVFERGTDEDMAVVTGLETAKRLLKARGYSSVLINADSSVLERLGQRIAEDLKLKVKTVLQIARAERALYRKVKLLMLLVMVVVGVCVSASLSSTMGANVLERQEEIGLMKALGARRLQIDAYFLSEALLEGLGGGVVGFLGGLILAELVTKTAFGGFIHLRPLVFVPVVFLSVVVSVFSTVLPVRRATATPASWILRGE